MEQENSGAMPNQKQDNDVSKAEPGQNVQPPQVSPIRPVNPNIAKPKQPAPLPTRPAKPSAGVQKPVEDSTDDLLAKPEEALERLRQKMAKVAQEYSEGVINKAQFNAIYHRYNEKREITERLMARNPDSNAWQSVVQPGHTSFLRDYFEAKIISYGLYRVNDGGQITLQGKVRLPIAQLMPIFAKIKHMLEQGHKLGSAWRQLRDGNWVFIVPGTLTASVVIFSTEPALIQREKVEDAHQDFERANAKILQRGDYMSDSLVFPHRALLQ